MPPLPPNETVKTGTSIIDAPVKTDAKELELFWEQFEVLTARESDRSPAWLRALRQAGIAQYAERGFPTIHHEEWRYTNLEALAQLDFRPLLHASSENVTPEAIRPFLIAEADVRLVFVNGHYAEQLSTQGSEHGRWTVRDLGRAMIDDVEVEQHLAHYAQINQNVFHALNVAFFQDGAYIRVPAEARVAQPIQILYVMTAPERGASTHPRNLILAGRHSQVTVIETYANLGGGQYFLNPVSEIVLGEGATVEHIKVQNDGLEAFHVGTVQAHQSAQSHFISHSISVGARLARHDIHSTMAEPGSTCLLNGLYLGAGHQLVDHHTVIDHAQPHCASHEFYHGILNGHAKGVFNGKIFVRKDAQKTDAKQTNRNLLLSNEATVDTKPQLEIYADDVRCTHGATVGQLDDDAIFYLRSRGIGEEEARQLLIHAFGKAILDRISFPGVSSQLDAWLLQQLGQPGQPDGD